MNEVALIKHGIYSKLNSLSGKELHSISDFIDFVYHKKKGSTKENNIKLQGILTGYSFNIADIKNIRSDSWKHLEGEFGDE